MKKNLIAIEFPLRGEWQAPTTPAKKVPSHGTNRMGLRYAFDFLQIDWESTHKPFHDVSFFRRFFLGVPLNRCYCWGQPIYAPFDGKVVMIQDGIPERKKVNWIMDSIIAIKNARTFDERNENYSQIAGNYILLKCTDGVYATLVHLQTGSINTAVNEEVKKGDLLGKVGHSGNSTSPHLHFQLMDSEDIANAEGIPFVFEQYEIFQNGNWKTVYNQIPSEKDRFRFNKE